MNVVNQKQSIVNVSKRIQQATFIETIASSLLMLLWIYTAGSKLMDLKDFKHQIHNQVFPDYLDGLLLYLIPSVEILAAALLYFSRTRFLGLTMSLILMFCFTTYIGLALLNVYSRMPCSCGGVLKFMGWKSHFIFNLFFTCVAAVGIIFKYKSTR